MLTLLLNNFCQEITDAPPLLTKVMFLVLPPIATSALTLGIFLEIRSAIFAPVVYHIPPAELLVILINFTFDFDCAEALKHNRPKARTESIIVKTIFFVFMTYLLLSIIWVRLF